MSDVDAIANLIREVDGSHSLGAGALAEALIERGVCLAPNNVLDGSCQQGSEPSSDTGPGGGEPSPVPARATH